MNKLKVAVVGCGFIAQRRHIPSFLRLKSKISLCAVCDLDQSLAKSVAGRFSVPNVYSELSKLLSKEKPDVVDVCTPPGIHTKLAVEAMESGCHVLLEKPMASDVPNCDRMIETSRRYGAKLSVVHNQRFYPPFLKAQELVENGIVGELTGMRVLSSTNVQTYLAHKNHWIHSLSGGVIGETGPHAVYMSLPFLKRVNSVNVSAKRKTDYPWVLYDDYRIELESDRINSSIYISHANNYSMCEVDLFGENYSLKIDLNNMLLIRYRQKNPTPISAALSSLNVAAQIVKGVVLNTFKVMFNKPMLGHQIMIEKFVNSIINDVAVPVAPEEGRETIRVMEMIINALEN